MDKEITEEQRQMLEQAGALEELVLNKGWTFVKSYISEKIQQFTNRALIDGFKNQEEYQFYRGEVAGLRSLLVEVENSLTNLNNFRDKQKSE